jgi:hypothetical protein
VVRRGALVSVLLVCALAVAAGAGVPSRTLPPLELEDQEGRTLSLATLRGRVVVLVYGTRDAVADSIAWGRRLQAEVHDTSEPRPLEIVAVAQMGGIPDRFQGIVRAALRQRTPASFSLWLDWEDRMSTLFGRHKSLPTVVVADRDGQVRLVVVGRADGAPWDAVTELLHRRR